jgi:hypothetical protein
MSTGGARAARQQFSRAGEVKVSAADALRRALFPPPPEDEGPSVIAQLADHVQNFEKEWQARKDAEAQAEADAAMTPAQWLIEALKGTQKTEDDDEEQPPTPIAPVLPLNGAALLRQAVSGATNATINGQRQ